MRQELNCVPVSCRESQGCNECRRTVTDIRILQHAGLTADGLRGIRLVFYIGMLANQAGWDIDKLYLIPIELTATLDRYSVGNLDPTLWLRDSRGIPLHHMIAQRREYRTTPEYCDRIHSLREEAVESPWGPSPLLYSV